VIDRLFMLSIGAVLFDLLTHTVPVQLVHWPLITFAGLVVLLKVAAPMIEKQ